MIVTINLKTVFKVISRNLLILSGSLFLCVFISLIYSEDILPFFYSSLVALGIGLLFHWLTATQKEDNGMHRKEAYLSVTLSWIFISLIGCLPYLFSASIPSFVNAIFESVSGFTTTGSSILTDIEALPRSILFWRSLTHWIGGLGIIVLFIIIMPSLQIGGYQLFTLESSLQEKIQPRIKSVGNRLLLIYVLLTVTEIILLLAGRMNLFESVCHAMATVSTGGFSPKNTSIAGYSGYIQYVIMLFMLFGGTNFVIHYYLIKRNWKGIRENEEFRFFLTVVFTVGAIITASLFFNMKLPLEESFRISFFQVISIITCTGFATADYLAWPLFSWLLIFLAMFLGGSTGSTAGGIKMARHLVFFKNLRRFFRRTAMPNVLIPLKLNGKIIPEDKNSAILTFISIYILFFAVATILLVTMGVDLTTAGGSVATCMAGIGPGLGTTGPVANFAHLPDMVKLTLASIMLVGRLEIYTVLILFTKHYWVE